MNEAPIVEVRDLTTRFYTEGGTVFAVNGVSYDLHEGETLGIVGESGSGKSVHALSIMGLISCPPGEVVGGTVRFRGRDLLGLSHGQMRRIRGREIAMIFQDPATSLNPVLTIGRQIGEALVLHMGISPRQAHDRAVALLEMVGIPQAAERVNAYPFQLSGGMRQRAMIAMALSCAPQVLIADEPTTALDVTIQAQILDLVRRLRDKLGMAIIWITHDLGIVAGLAERVLVMYAGFVVEDAPVKDLYADPRHPYTLGLLASLPRMDAARDQGEHLRPIGGQPPDLIGLPQGCPFQPRCPYRIERCAENPALTEIAPERRLACWVDVRSTSPIQAAAPSEAAR